MNRLREEIAEDITAECIKDIWLNVDDNWVIKLLYDGNAYYVEISAKEIADSTDSDFSAGIRSLINSSSVSYTLDHIEAIEKYIKYFSDQEIQELLQAATTNNNIYSISYRSDVRKFFLSIFGAKSQIIPEDIRKKFEEKFQDDPNI